jgi:hypothetical protein
MEVEMHVALYLEGNTRFVCAAQVHQLNLKRIQSRGARLSR